MHIESALISTAVAVGFTAMQTGAAAVALKKTGSELSSVGIRKVAAAGALVFALQMLNYSIPGTGSSGHVVGAILLCILLGRWTAFLTMGAILTVQALCFGDGGLLALSCNWFNMGFIPCLLVYPLAERLFKGNTDRIALITPVVSLLIGAFAASVEIGLSGRASLSFTDLLGKMLFIHLFIGIGEGLIIWSVLKVLQAGKSWHPELKLIVMAFIAGGLISLFASVNPDGLEWSLTQVLSATDGAASAGLFHAFFDNLQQSTVFMPEYSLESMGSLVGKSLSGIIGVSLAFLFIFSLSFLPVSRKSQNRL